MKTRLAFVVELKRQPGQIYLVADGCPHPRPDSAPFRACMLDMKVGVQKETGEDGYARIATCEYLSASEPVDAVSGDDGDYLVSCSFDSGSRLGSGAEFGIPIVSHSDDDTEGDKNG